MILIDMDSISKDSVEIVYEVNANTATSKVPVIIILPQDISEELSNALNQQIISVTRKVCNNALDVLKEIRTYLCIDKKDIDEKEKYIEENIVETDAAAAFATSFSKSTILIVDDDSDSLFTISEFVKELDYDTIFAHNGMECLVTLNHVEPDLILLDIMMPQMDGFETIKRIRADKRFSNIPVIALTAYAMLDNKNVIEKNGFDDLVTKPVNSKILASKIKRYLKAKVN
jgi:CheY-like chemotaxis protein